MYSKPHVNANLLALEDKFTTMVTLHHQGLPLYQSCKQYIQKFLIVEKDISVICTFLFPQQIQPRVTHHWYSKESSKSHEGWSYFGNIVATHPVELHHI